MIRALETCSGSSNGVFRLCNVDGSDGFATLEPSQGGGCTYMNPRKKYKVLSDKQCVNSNTLPSGTSFEEAAAMCDSDSTCGGIQASCSGQGQMSLCTVDPSTGVSILENGGGACFFQNPNHPTIYTLHGRKRCKSFRAWNTPRGLDYSSLRYIDQALSACMNDKACGGVYDYKVNV